MKFQGTISPRIGNLQMLLEIDKTNKTKQKSILIPVSTTKDVMLL